MAAHLTEQPDKMLRTRSSDFDRQAERLRPELKLHCYRLLGSLHEAEDALQETYIRAWKSFGSFDGKSFRAWMYKIATNACLNLIEKRKHTRRYLPDQLGASTTKMPDGPPATEISWLEPYPDSYLDQIPDSSPTPEAKYAERETVKLAFVSAIQILPPRQRTALLLCDVLDWSSSEAAGLLGATTVAINSALQRARKTLSTNYPHCQPMDVGRPSSEQQQLLDRYMHAWEGHDLDGFVSLLKEDATVTMPPFLQWYAGRDAIRAFFSVAWQSCYGLRLVPISANGQPGFAAYRRSKDDHTFRPDGIHVLTLENDCITGLTAFLVLRDTRLFAAFGLPPFWS
jgi:RNA polymerase sigma-70 factor (ECF subfamily)